MSYILKNMYESVDLIPHMVSIGVDINTNMI